MKKLMSLFALLLAQPVQASEIVIFGDSWAEPMGPALRTVLTNHGHPDVTVHTTDFWGLATRLGSANGLAYISEQLNAQPNADIVVLSVGYNDVHCELVNSTCQVKWMPSMAGSQAESAILDEIVIHTETIVDHIESIRPGTPVLLQSYDFMRPLAEMATKGTPPENNAVHLKWAERVAALAQRKPTLTFVDLHGLMQVTYGFDGIARTPYDPSHPIPAGDPSLPDANLPSPYYPFGRDRTHLSSEGFEVLAEGHYEGFYGPLLNDPGARIGSGHSGAWFNRETSGQGQLIDVDAANQYLFLAWFAFGADPDGGQSEPHWYTAQGQYAANVAELTIYETLGGRLDSPQEVTTRAVGEAVLTFADCSQGQLDYVIDTLDVAGSIPLERLIPNSDVICAERSGSAVESMEVNAGMDGAWFNAESPGQGFLMDVHHAADGSNYIFVAWFTYREDTVSGQRWLTAQGPFAGSVSTLDLYETTGGRFDDPQPVNTVAVGTLTIGFEDCRNASVEYDMPGAALQGAMTIQRLQPATEALCVELASPE